MAIVLDAMGSDEFPVPEIFPAIELASQGEKVILVGKKELLLEKLKSMKIDSFPVEIVERLIS